MKRIGIVGAGTMGIGVAQLFAENEYDVVLVDIADDILDRARREIARNVRLAPLVRPGVKRISLSELDDRINFTKSIAELSDVDYVVENVTEDWPTKRRLYEQLDSVCRADAILGVNTSAILITRVASVTGRAPLVVGVHFMNPAPLKPTVEVIRGVHTSQETIEQTRALLATAGKSCIVVEDSPGFVTNRVLMITINEAIFLLWERVASVQQIDRLFKECFGHSMGPLETADLIGLDTVLLSLEVLYDELNDPKYRPCPLLRKMVYAGRTGKKSGQGFRPYETSTTQN